MLLIFSDGNHRVATYAQLAVEASSGSFGLLLESLLDLPVKYEERRPLSFE